MTHEITESFRIAFAEIRAHKLRSALTALGVIIGIVAVTLMGTAINGIGIGFDRSLAMLGDDIMYVNKWPWHNVEDWWNYANRPAIVPEDADRLNRLIAATPESQLDVAVFVGARSASVKAGDYSVSGVYTFGTTADYGRMLTADFAEGRLFSDTESAAARPRPCFRAGPPSEAPSPWRASRSASSASSPIRDPFSASSASTAR